jgi:hypothetical protein
MAGLGPRRPGRRAPLRLPPRQLPVRPRHEYRHAATTSADETNSTGSLPCQIAAFWRCRATATATVERRFGSCSRDPDLSSGLFVQPRARRVFTATGQTAIRATSAPHRSVSVGLPQRFAHRVEPSLSAPGRSVQGTAKPCKDRRRQPIEPRHPGPGAPAWLSARPGWRVGHVRLSAAGSSRAARPRCPRPARLARGGAGASRRGRRAASSLPAPASCGLRTRPPVRRTPATARST